MMPVKVITYDPQYASAFRNLNLEWIRKYFKVEAKDEQQTSRPDECIEAGGEIFFIISDREAVGTCALYKIDVGLYELAKMAVAPECRGRGYGDLLIVEAERWASERGAREIMMLSNTVLEPAISLYHKHGYETVHLGPHPEYERCNIELRKIL